MDAKVHYLTPTMATREGREDAEYQLNREKKGGKQDAVMFLVRHITVV